MSASSASSTASPAPASAAEFPQEADRRRYLGKFYYRPPSGESWCDVALRVRSLLRDVEDRYDGERVWVFSHQAVIMSFRLVLEGLGEREILDLDARLPDGELLDDVLPAGPGRGARAGVVRRPDRGPGQLHPDDA